MRTLWQLTTSSWVRELNEYCFVFLNTSAHSTGLTAPEAPGDYELALRIATNRLNQAAAARICHAKKPILLCA
jgi:hypothetical protein